MAKRLLIDKYTPKTLDEIFFHKELVNILKTLTNEENVPHIIFYGPSGTGKKTLIYNFLKQLHLDIETQDVEHTINSSGNKNKILTFKQSPNHIEIIPKNNNFDRHIIHTIVDDFGKYLTFQSPKHFKTILIHSIDRLSKHAQTSLRRTMELYSENCRFIMWCNSLSSVIEPITSRCVCFRVPCPTNEELYSFLMDISMEEKLNISLKEMVYYVNNCNGNLRVLFLFLQHKLDNISLSNDYQEIISKIIDKTISLNLSNISEIRELIYSVSITGISANIILKDLLLDIIKKVNPKHKSDIINLTSKCDHNLALARRDIMHFDTFIIGCMRLLSN